jgi:hypothetical protein
LRQLVVHDGRRQRYVCGDVSVAEQRSTVPTGARVGVWLGCFGWILGLAAVAAPELPRLAVPVLGAVALTGVVAFSLDRMLASLYQSRAWLGAMMAAIGAFLLYYALALEPALHGEPELLERLRLLGSVVHVPAVVGAALLGVGVALTAIWWPRRQRA